MELHGPCLYWNLGFCDVNRGYRLLGGFVSLNPPKDVWTSHPLIKDTILATWGQWGHSLPGECLCAGNSSLGSEVFAVKSLLSFAFSMCTSYSSTNGILLAANCLKFYLDFGVPLKHEGSCKRNFVLLFLPVALSCLLSFVHTKRSCDWCWVDCKSDRG